MKGENLFAVIGRLRRSMPRNADVTAVCDALEARLASIADMPKAGFDRRAYQRKYMREWRMRRKQAELS